MTRYLFVYRPVQDRRRVAPDAFRKYRETHKFLGPCCLCPLLAPLSEEPSFIEAAIYIPLFGRCAGEYVAACAKSQCGYVGQSPFTRPREMHVHIPHPSPIGKNISQVWRPGEDVSA
jgi:hypothetical protein